MSKMKIAELLTEDITSQKNLIVFDLDDTLWDPYTGKPRSRMFAIFNGYKQSSDEVIILTARSKLWDGSTELPQLLDKIGIKDKVNFAGDSPGNSYGERKVNWLTSNFDLNDYATLTVYDDLKDNLGYFEKLNDKFKKLKIKTIHVK